METTRIRNLHRYARPVEPTPFFNACRANTNARTERAELDKILDEVWADKRAQHGNNLSTVLGRPEA